MRIYEYNESDKTLNTECGLFHIGDTVQLTEIDSQTPVKTVLYGARIDSTEYVILFFDEKCGMPLYLSEHDRKVSFELLSAPSLHHHDY